MIRRTTTPKYQTTADALRKEIASGNWKPGEQLPGERLLAQRFNVSYMTLRHAISSLVDDGELVRILSKGTFVADKLPERESTRRPITLLFPGDPVSLDPYYFPEVLTGFLLEMNARGVSANCRDYIAADDPRIIEPGSAIGCLLLTRQHFDLVDRLLNRNMLVLAINPYRGRRNVPSVCIDDEGGIAAAVSYLASMGHTRIGFLKGPSTDLGAQSRLAGFRRAAKSLGLNRVIEAGEGFSEAAGYAAAAPLLDIADRPTAVMCASDLAAIGFLRAVRERGLSIPNDLSVIGFGDFPVAYDLQPRLTTIRQPRADLGATAAAALIELAEERLQADRLLPADLVLRNSVERLERPVEAVPA